MNNMSLCELISHKIYDYRKGEIPPLCPQHVKKWADQFSNRLQKTLLEEINYTLGKSYIPKTIFQSFIEQLLFNKNLVVGDASTFWRSVNFLNIQQAGNSQKDMLDIFNIALSENFGFGIENCGSPEGLFIYLDDIIFTGNRVRRDIEAWVTQQAPVSCKIHIIVMACHASGQWYADNNITRTIIETGKTIPLKWWNCSKIEDRKKYINSSDVLRPIGIPYENNITQYIKILEDEGYPVLFRQELTPHYISSFFSNETGRQYLEEVFLESGVKIINNSSYFPYSMRPLGFSKLRILGFGSLLVSYRNCPNTTPLALWAGNPWYPLFPRKTN